MTLIGPIDCAARVFGGLSGRSVRRQVQQWYCGVTSRWRAQSHVTLVTWGYLQVSSRQRRLVTPCNAGKSGEQRSFPHCKTRLYRFESQLHWRRRLPTSRLQCLAFLGGGFCSASYLFKSASPPPGVAQPPRRRWALPPTLNRNPPWQIDPLGSSPRTQTRIPVVYRAGRTS